MLGALVLIGLALIFFGPKLWRELKNFQARRAYATDIANVELIDGPRIVMDAWEGDQDTIQRGDDLKGLLRLSNNQWITEKHIIVRCYHPNSYGKTHLTFAAWRVATLNDFDKICLAFHKEIPKTGEYDAAIYGQQTMNGQN